MIFDGEHTIGCLINKQESTWANVAPEYRQKRYPLVWEQVFVNRTRRQKSKQACFRRKLSGRQGTYKFNVGYAEELSAATRKYKMALFQFDSRDMGFRKQPGHTVEVRRHRSRSP